MSKQSERRSLDRRIAGVTMPIGRKRIRYGRNFPCLCGSGKKYKRCCMEQIDTTTAHDGNATVIELSQDVQKMIDYLKEQQEAEARINE
jgi:hypothetical protein